MADVVETTFDVTLHNPFGRSFLCKDTVCPLSCEVMFQPLSVPLQDGVRFFHIPLPALHSASLTVCLPAVTQEKYGFTMFLVYDK